MSSKVRGVFVTVCAVLFLMLAVTRHGGTVTRSADPVRLDSGDRADAARDLLALIGQTVRERADEIAATGDWYRTVPLYNKNSGEELELRVTPDGIVAADQEQDVRDFFACRRTGKRLPLNRGVLAMLADLADRFPGHTIEIISGVRARPYGVRGSKHFVGRAIDLRIEGVRLSTVRDYLWRNHQQVGVGYYPHHGFVHMDYRPNQTEAAWTQRRSGKYRKNPRWARRARARARAI